MKVSFASFENFWRIFLALQWTNKSLVLKLISHIYPRMSINCNLLFDFLIIRITIITIPSSSSHFHHLLIFIITISSSFPTSSPYYYYHDYQISDFIPFFFCHVRLFSTPLSNAVLNPEPEPVDIATSEEMEPLHHFLRCFAASANAPTPSHDSTLHTLPGNLSFPRGTLCTDKRLDLCKQVIGPSGVDPLMTSLYMDATR